MFVNLYSTFGGTTDRQFFNISILKESMIRKELNEYNKYKRIQLFYFY